MVDGRQSINWLVEQKRVLRKEYLQQNSDKNAKFSIKTFQVSEEPLSIEM